MEGFDPSKLTQQQMSALMELGILDEQDAMLQEQMAQAEALAHPGPEHTTPGGAVLGGLADIMNNMSSKRQMGGLRKEREGLLGKKKAGRETFAGLFGFGGGPQSPATPDTGGGVFGYHGGQSSYGGVPAPQPSSPESPFGNLRPTTPFGYGGRYGYIPGGY